MEKEKNLNEEGIDPEINATEELTDSENSLNIGKYKSVFIVVAIAIVVIGAVWFFRYKQEQDSIRASVLLSRVSAYIESADFQKALDGDPAMKYGSESVVGLIKIVKDFEGTDQGKIAALHAASAYSALNKYKEAKKYYEIAKNSSAKDIQAGANAGLASCLELEGKFVESAEMYEKASTLSDVENVKARYLTYSALCYEKANNKENAEKYFRQVVDFYKNSEFVSIAKSGLVRIGTVIE